MSYADYIEPEEKPMQLCVDCDGSGNCMCIGECDHAKERCPACDGEGFLEIRGGDMLDKD